MRSPFVSLVLLGLLVAACGGALTNEVADASKTDTSGFSASDASALSDASVVDAARDSNDAGSAQSTCPVSSPAAKQNVTFHITNSATQARWLVTEGFFCDTFAIAQGGVAVPQTLGFQCVCECPNPGPPRADTYRKLLAGESYDIKWAATALATCTEKFDCRTQWGPNAGIVDVYKGFRLPLSAGHFEAKVAFEEALPANCTEAGGEARCSYMPTGWTSPGNAVVASMCPSLRQASVEFDLPASGDLTVAVTLK